ncbi:MAG: M28 family peptidase, partial [Acidobacteria bacterium]|nr:M28 family peptidase [Acidobacteriota bacterium]
GARGKNGRPSYMQSYPYVTGVEPSSDNQLSFGVYSGDTSGYYGLDLLNCAKTGLRYSSTACESGNGLPVGFSINGAVTEAPVAFAGYGIVAKDVSFDDYAQQPSAADVRGNVVMVFDGNPDNDNPHSAFGRFDIRTKALIAKEHGAVGMLVISREEVFDRDPLTRMTYDQSLGETAIPTFVISRRAACEIAGVDQASLKTIEEQSAGKQNAVKANAHLINKSSRASFKVNLVKKSVEAYNVIGILDGTDKTLKNEAIVIGAHYDHLGHGGQGSLAANSTEIHHGADDNASGTAAIMELAREFAVAKKNKRTIIFIAFSGEEEGLFGSSYYVQNPVFPLDKTVAMINLDMVGRLKDNKLDVGGIGTASEFKALVESNNPHDLSTTPIAVNPNMQFNPALPGKFQLALSDDGYGRSDHSSFYGKKVPVLFFFTGTHNDYHKPSDTADKINYPGEVSVINYVAAIEQAIDQNPVRPTYTVAKSSGTGGRATFNISLGTIPNYADSNDGLLLDGVRDGSPAAKGGVKAGDKVIKLAGHDIRNVMDYTYVLGEMKADVEYEIVVLRGGEKLTLKVIPVRRQ